MAGIAGAYVAVVGAYIVFAQAPAAQQLRTRAEALQAEYAMLGARAGDLRDALGEIRQLARTGARTAADRRKAGAVRATLRAVTEHFEGVQAGLLLKGIPPAMRAALADAADAESRLAGVLLETLDYLDLGDVEAAGSRVAGADASREDLLMHLDEAQRLGLADVVESERLLETRTSQIVRAIGLWALLGATLLALALLLLHRRLYAPLKALDSGLAGVAGGDLHLSLPVRRQDELGRLTASFNQMTDVLRGRAEEERRRASSLVDTQAATYRISEAAHTARTLQDLFVAIHHIVGELMPARNVYIALQHAATGIISFPYFVDEFDQTPAPKRPGKGLTEYVLRTGQPLLATPDVALALERRGEIDLIGAPSIDWLGVPLTAEGRTIGVLVVQTYTEGVRYDAADRDVLQFVSTQVAMAIERKRSEEALRESEATLQVFINAIPEPALLLDVEGTIVAANRAMAERLGGDLIDIVGRYAYGLLPEAIAASRKQHIQAAVRSRKASVFEDAMRGRSYINYVYQVLDTGGTVTRVAIFALDITDRKRAEEAVQRSEEQYRTLVEGVKDVIFALSPDAAVTALNPAFEEITGWTRDEWLGKPFVGLLHPDDIPPALDLLGLVLRGESRGAVRLRVRTRGGEHRVGEFRANAQLRDGAVAGILGIVRDITDRVRLEDELRQAQKMEAVGRLAGGVAHDFNNLLTAISSYSELLLADFAREDPRRADVEEIRKATERAAGLTRQLLAFSRRQVLQPKVLDLNAVIGGAEKLLRRLIGENIMLVTRLDPALGAVRADAGQLEQVIMNLAVNARDAMRDGGTLTLETANIEFEAAAQTAEQSIVAPGSYVLLLVRDTGAGMDAQTKRHLFEQFFTTREKGRGTGLGLATVYGIVKQSGGFIWVDSEPGQGTTFRINLPRVDAVARPAERSEPPAQPATAGTETILLVEDEDAVRAVVRESLRRQGYAVLEAPNAEAALEISAGFGGHIELLLTDVVMPGLSGRALADRLVVERPDTKVLYMSGYTDDAIVRHGVLEPGLNYLQKPFTPDVLTHRVREVLNAESP
jgi:two-component system cell cycle sensor histidine kinase/response regulator CckA